MRLVLAVSLALVAAVSAVPAAAAKSQTGTVRSVVDGDTVKIKVGSATRTFDLLGVRAPRGSECFAAEARKALGKLLKKGTRVKLEADPKRGGRGRYVFKGSSLINAAMLRAGNAKLGSTSSLKRASTLRFAGRSAENGKKGLFGACAGGGPTPNPTPNPDPTPTPTPTAPGAVETADFVRTTLTGKQLLDIRSTSNPPTSTKNTTRFCPGGRAERIEDFTHPDFPSRDEYAGAWAILGTFRQADGSILTEILFASDRSDVSPRQIVLKVFPDGSAKLADGTASQLEAGGACRAATPTSGRDNDTQAAHDKALQGLLNKRLTEPSGNTTDVCTGPRAIRREGGAVVADGPFTIEYALSDSTGTLAVLVIKDGQGRNRRLLVFIDAGGAHEMRNLFEFSEDSGHSVTLGPATC